MNYKQSILSAAIVASLSFAAQLHAQETSAPAQTTTDATELETVTVIGIRGSIEKSLDAKRNENSRVEVITSEDIGKMPDKNVADALSRVPGVNISAASANEGAFDENDRVSMRGTSPSFTQTLIDGHNIASGDWFVLNQTGTVGRSVSYSLLPSELVDKVVVRKSSEAKLVEGGAVGNVDIITRNPLNFDQGFSIFGSLGGVYAELPGKTDPQLSVLGNYKNQDGSFGLTVQAFSEERHLRRDGQELLGYEQILAGSNIALSNPDLAGVYYPKAIGSALFEQERKRTGGMLTAQFKPSDDIELTAKYFTSKMEADNYNRNYMIYPVRILSQGAGQAPDPGYVVRDNTLVDANFTGIAGRQYGIYDMISRPGAQSDSNFFSLGGTWSVSERLKLSAEGGTSKGHGKSPTQDVFEADTAFGAGAGWSLHGVGAADWNLGATDNSAPGMPPAMALDWIFGYQDINVVDKEDWAKIDGELFFDGGAFKSLEFGIRGAKHSRNNDRVTAQGPGCLDANGSVLAFDWSQQYFCPVGSESPFDPANWPQGFSRYPGDFASSLGGSYPTNIWYWTPSQLAEFNRFTNRDPVARFDFTGAYGLAERSNAAYAQANFEGERWSGNVGVRFVQTKEEITNYVVTNAADPDAILTSAFGPFKMVQTNHTYNDWLPSANFKYEINDDMVLRLAASRTLTRPDYSALAGAVQLTQPGDLETGIGSGFGGNPDLEPVLSTNFDATFEWYYAPRALFSAGVFAMDIDNYVSLSTVRREYMAFDQAHPDGVMVPFDITIPVSSSAKVKGFELAWEAPIGEYFGGFANYTYANGDTDDGLGMLGTSKNTYNFGLWFENQRFNARVNYTFRSSFYSGLDRNSAFYQDDVDSVSASFGYKLNDNMSLSLDALNLNNPKTAYYAETRTRPRSIYENGRQYYLNLRFKF